VVELVGELLHAVVGHRDDLGVERVGLDQVRACLEVLAVDAADQVGLGQAQQVVVPPQVTGPVREPLAAVVRLLELVPLDHRPHGAVEDEQALLERGGELLGGVWTDERGV
jgi:hypothetical protein